MRPLRQLKSGDKDLYIFVVAFCFDNRIVFNYFKPYFSN